MIGPSYGRLSALAGPNADRLLDRNNKHSAIVNFTRPSLTYNGLNRAPNAIVRDYDFKFKLRQKIAEILATPGHRCVIYPPAQHFDFANRHPLDPDFDQSLSHLVHSERLDDCLDLLHPMQTVSRFLVESNRTRYSIKVLPAGNFEAWLRMDAGL